MDFTKSNYELSKNYFALITCIRQYFNDQGFLDLPSPPMVPHPGLEAHLHPYEIISTKDKKKSGYFLHTSPEFFMKEMLALGHEKIFTINHCHRDEPTSATHLPQFLMLEWYRANHFYTKIMDDTESLVKKCFQTFNKEVPLFQRKTVDEIFQEIVGFKISNYLGTEELIIKIKEYDSSLITDINLNWDDYFFLLFLNKIEPELKKYPALILYEYPIHLAALSTLKNEKVCERFELYINGLELANCFNELTNESELVERFKIENKNKEEQYSYQLPEPKRFFQVQEKLPKSTGIALGIDRLFMCLFEQEEIYSPSNFFKASDN